MKELITIAVFNNAFDIKYNLLKDMLDEADIKYITNNENARVVKPMPFITPTNMSIDIKVYEKDLDEAVKIMASIS
ncbi:putative signal transducing protein [Bacteroidota bacterium]